MKSTFVTIASIVVSGLIFAQQTKEIPITGTNNLVIKTNTKVLIYKSEQPKVVLKADQMSEDSYIISSDSEGTTIHDGKSSSKNAVIELYTNQFNHLNISGASTVQMVDELMMDNVTISVSGASSFNGKMVNKQLEITVSGASDARLTGSGNTVTAVVSGSSDLKMLDYITPQMTITASGASDAYVDVTQELNAVATGASDIYYKSAPPQLNANSSEQSDIRQYGGSSTDNQYNYQYNDNDSTSTKKKRRFAASFKDMYGGGKKHQSLVWMGIDLGMDGLIDVSNGFDFQPQGDYNFMEQNYPRNTHVRLNFFEWRFNIAKDIFNIVTGMGWDFHHYSFTQKIKLDEADDYPGQSFTTPIIGVPDTLHSINRSRLAVQYFNIPLFLNLRTKITPKSKHQFNFTFGVVGGIRTGASSRIIYTEGGRDVTEEKFDDFNLEMFTATAMVRIKYSFFSIYASYQFTPMFRGQNPNLYPFSIGVTLLSW